MVYDNGITVTANGTSALVRLGSLVLPRYGWVAQGRGFVAYTALQGGLMVDYADNGNSLFINSRNPANDPFMAGLAEGFSLDIPGRVNMSGKVVDFGDVRTNGEVFLSCTHGAWTLRNYRPEADVVIELAKARFQKIDNLQGDNAPLAAQDTGTHWRIPTNGAALYHWQGTNAGPDDRCAGAPSQKPTAAQPH